MTFTLVVGNKNYSSWSLRPWFYLRHHGISFEEVRIPLYRGDSREKILAFSPSGKVPILIADHTRVWDSLAILEYVAELRPETGGWPKNIDDRALARSLAAEMHAGFQALRTHCPMNCRRQPKAKDLSDETAKDVARIRAIWRSCREQRRDQGPWLLGTFGIIDAMYAPVALRFHSYRLAGSDIEEEYVATVLGHPAIGEWIEAARRETEIIEAFEV